jgi:hypothetical protein
MTTAEEVHPSVDDGEPTPMRQCGRCRAFFPFDNTTSPGPKWWLCPPCHKVLLGKGTFKQRNN